MENHRKTALSGMVIGVCVGRVRPMPAAGRVHHTAFVKEPVPGPVALGPLGLEGDEHHYPDHGGPDQALLVYSADHYPAWATELGLDLAASGAFGENLTVTGLTETEVSIGDVFSIGPVVAQVTSPRAPCYKIGARFGHRDLPLRMQDTDRTGYLMRVLTPGMLQAGETMALLSRPEQTVTVAEAARVRNVDRDDWEAVGRVAAIPELAAGMRATLEARLASREPEPDEFRLYGE